MDFTCWSAPKVKIFEKINASSLIGVEAIKLIDNLFLQFADDKIIAGLNNLKEETNQLNIRVQQTINNLGLINDHRLEDTPIYDLARKYFISNF